MKSKYLLLVGVLILLCTPNPASAYLVTLDTFTGDPVAASLEIAGDGTSTVTSL